MTTNHETAIDQAFLRRLAFHVRVPMPDDKHRELLWRSMLPDKAEHAGDLDFSELARRFEMSGFAATHVHISKDAWPNARKKEERQRRLIDEHLRSGKPVVVDNTNPTPLERELLIAIARQIGVRVASCKKLVPPTSAEKFDHRFEVRLTAQGLLSRELG